MASKKVAWALLLAAAVSGTAAGGARADQERGKSGPARTIPADDVVALKDGGIVRGQISEKVPNSHVTVVTLTGDVRRFDWANVAYAGSAAAWVEHAGRGGAEQVTGGEPPAEPPPGVSASDLTGSGAPRQPTSPREARSRRGSVAAAAPNRARSERTKDARLVFKEPGGHTLYLRKVVAGQYGPTTSYDELCTAPCEATIASGSHVLAVTRPLASAPVTAGPLEISPGVSEVRASITDTRGQRVVGIVVLFAGPMVGLTLMTLGLVHLEEDCSSGFCTHEYAPDEGLLLGGAALTVAGVGGGLALILQRDSAEIDVKKVEGSSHGAAAFWRLRPSLPSVALRGRF